MAIIALNLPIKYFEKDRHNRLEARLAKFELHQGDIIRFHEWDPKTNTRTGRFYDRIVRDFHKIHRAIRHWKKKDLLTYGLYVFELDDITRKSR